jgi:putative Ca2+/H+ antiporter (TMEM165/GDT1 family)
MAAAAALTVSTAIAVAAGGVLSRYIPPATLKLVAGSGFVLVGLWTIFTARQ